MSKQHTSREHQSFVLAPSCPPPLAPTMPPCQHMPASSASPRSLLTKTGGKSSEKATMFEVAFGVPWSEEAFIKEALLRGHPVHLFESLHSNLSNAIRSNVNEKPEKIVTDRAAWFKKWTRRALELRETRSRTCTRRCLAIEDRSSKEKGSCCSGRSLRT